MLRILLAGGTLKQTSWPALPVDGTDDRLAHRPDLDKLVPEVPDQEQQAGDAAPMDGIAAFDERIESVAGGAGQDVDFPGPQRRQARCIIGDRPEHDPVYGRPVA